MSLKPTTAATIAHYVNGHVVAGGSARQQAVFNPATGAVTGQVALANAADVQCAVPHDRRISGQSRLPGLG